MYLIDYIEMNITPGDHSHTELVPEVLKILHLYPRWQTTSCPPGDQGEDQSIAELIRRLQGLCNSLNEMELVL